MNGFLNDLRLGFRMLVRTPLLSAVAILTIGLGVVPQLDAFTHRRDSLREKLGGGR